MKHMSWMKWSVLLILAGVLGMPAAQAADQTPSRYGPGMMGDYGYGPGMGQRGYGPGMMYGNGGGYGGYGRGMMGRGWGGYGMGPGMMGGYDMGPGMMMGLGPVWSLNLTDHQRRTIEHVLDEQHQLHWSMMSSLFTDYGKLSALYDAEHLDAGAIGKVYDDIFKTRRAMLESSIKARNRIYDQLTKEQKEQLQRYRWERW